jgi:hypothetical protein
MMVEMADASKLKNRRSAGLGSPPPLAEARSDLAPPEAVGGNIRGEANLPEADPPERIDGRSLRRSGRTVQFATRVSPEFDTRIRTIAKRERLLLVEVLEKALDAYEAKR